MLERAPGAVGAIFHESVIVQILGKEVEHVILPRFENDPSHSLSRKLLRPVQFNCHSVETSVVIPHFPQRRGCSPVSWSWRWFVKHTAATTKQSKVPPT